MTHALKRAYRKSELIRRIEETDYNFSASQLDEIQGALAQQALVSRGDTLWRRIQSESAGRRNRG